MDQAKKMNHHEEIRKQLARKFSRANSSKGRCLIPVKRKPQRGITTTLDDDGDVRDKVEAHEPRLVQLNFKASLMGVRIYGDKDHFFTKQSSMSSNRLSGKFRSGVSSIPCCSGGRPSVDLLEKNNREIAIVASSKRAQKGAPEGESKEHFDRRSATSPERFKAVSGVLYPSPQVGNNTNSSILNAVHFTFDASTDGYGGVTEKIYQQLLEQSRLQKCNDGGKLEVIHQTQRSSSVTAKTDRYSDAVSTPNPRLSCYSDALSTPNPRVSCSSSLTFSERLFGYEFSRDSPQRPSRPDAKIASSTNLEPNLSHRNNLQMGQNSRRSIPAIADYDDTDDDDIILEEDIIFEVPSGISLHCSHDQRHYAELVKVEPKPRPTKRERWSSSKQSFNLELERQSMKTLSINVNRNRQHQSAEPGRSVNARAKLDVSHRDISCMSSLHSSFNGGSRRLKGGAISSFRSDRSGWLEFESEMNDFVLDSGRLKIDMRYEPDLCDKPDLLVPDMEEVAKGVNNSQDDGAKMDEEDFPFNSPIASTFVFGDGLKKCPEDAQQQTLNTNHSSMPRTVLVETDSDNEDLDHSDVYHDPDDGSVSDTDSSLTTFSLEADSTGVLEQQPSSQWVSTRSFNYLREVVDHNSGFLDIECQSGRFSVDLRQGKMLGRVDHPPRPGMRLSLMKTEKPSSRRSLLAPCLVCVSCWHQRPQDP